MRELGLAMDMFGAFDRGPDLIEPCRLKEI